MTSQKRITRYKIELVRESAKNYTIGLNDKVTSPLSLARMFKVVHELDRQTEEILILACFDTKNKVIGTFEVSRGSLSASIVHPREVFKRALLCNSACIAIAHNHPSGDPLPSIEDEEITKRLAEAGTLLGIHLLDHVIIGDDDFYSFKEGGLL